MIIVPQHNIWPLVPSTAHAWLTPADTAMKPLLFPLGGPAVCPSEPSPQHTTAPRLTRMAQAKPLPAETVANWPAGAASWPVLFLPKQNTFSVSALTAHTKYAPASAIVTWPPYGEVDSPRLTLPPAQSSAASLARTAQMVSLPAEMLVMAVFVNSSGTGGA